MLRRERMKIIERDTKVVLELLVRYGKLRKFWRNGHSLYIDNRVPPSKEEIMQTKALKDWKPPHGYMP